MLTERQWGTAASKPNGSAEINQSLEAEISANINELTCTSSAFRQVEIAGDEIAANSVGPFFAPDI